MSRAYIPARLRGEPDRYLPMGSGSVGKCPNTGWLVTEAMDRFPTEELRDRWQTAAAMCMAAADSPNAETRAARVKACRGEAKAGVWTCGRCGLIRRGRVA